MFRPRRSSWFSLALIGALALPAGAAFAGIGPGPVAEAGPDGSRWYSAPSTSAVLVKTDPAGHHNNVDCRTRGDFVRIPGTKLMTNVWYRHAYHPDGVHRWVSAADVRITSTEKPYDCAGVAVG